MHRIRMIACGCAAIIIAVAIPLITGGLDASANSGQTAIPTLYGTQGHEPLVSGATVRVIIPGGTLVAKNNETEYVLTDHLGSGRIGINAAATTHDEYGPFGAPETGDSPTYAGKTYDQDAEAYDFVARRYDPDSARFLATDPKRESGGPYSYSNNNPVNLVDPDGEAPIHFLLYSRYGIETLDHTGIASIRDNVEGIYNLSKTMSSTLVVAAMDGSTPVRIPSDPIQNSHMTIIAHGLPDLINVINPRTGALATVTGAIFPEALNSGMARIFEEDAQRVARGIRSMGILSCHGACRMPDAPGYPENSFAEQFARGARPFFPNLEEVVASHYEIRTGPGRNAAHLHEFELGVLRWERGYPEILGRYMNMENFVSGRYPDDLYRPAWDARFNTLSQTFHVLTGHGATPWQGQTDWPSHIERHVQTHMQDYLEPVLRRVPVLPPPITTEE